MLFYNGNFNFKKKMIYDLFFSKIEKKNDIVYKKNSFFFFKFKKSNKFLALEIKDDFRKNFLIKERYIFESEKNKLILNGKKRKIGYTLKKIKNSFIFYSFSALLIKIHFFFFKYLIQRFFLFNGDIFVIFCTFIRSCSFNKNIFNSYQFKTNLLSIEKTGVSPFFYIFGKIISKRLHRIIKKYKKFISLEKKRLYCRSMANFQQRKWFFYYNQNLFEDGFYNNFKLKSIFTFNNDNFTLPEFYILHYNVLKNIKIDSKILIKFLRQFLAHKNKKNSIYTMKLLFSQILCSNLFNRLFIDSVLYNFIGNKLDKLFFVYYICFLNQSYYKIIARRKETIQTNNSGGLAYCLALFFKTENGKKFQLIKNSNISILQTNKSCSGLFFCRTCNYYALISSSFSNQVILFIKPILLILNINYSYLKKKGLDYKKNLPQGLNGLWYYSFFSWWSYQLNLSSNDKLCLLLRIYRMVKSRSFIEYLGFLKQKSPFRKLTHSFELGKLMVQYKSKSSIKLKFTFEKRLLLSNLGPNRNKKLLLKIQNVFKMPRYFHVLSEMPNQVGKFYNPRITLKKIYFFKAILQVEQNEKSKKYPNYNNSTLFHKKIESDYRYSFDHPPSFYSQPKKISSRKNIFYNLIRRQRGSEFLGFLKANSQFLVMKNLKLTNLFHIFDSLNFAHQKARQLYGYLITNHYANKTASLLEAFEKIIYRCKSYNRNEVKNFLENFLIPHQESRFSGAMKACILVLFKNSTEKNDRLEFIKRKNSIKILRGARIRCSLGINSINIILKLVMMKIKMITSLLKRRSWINIEKTSPCRSKIYCFFDRSELIFENDRNSEHFVLKNWA